MKNFNYHQSTKIVFGSGRVAELPEYVKAYGNKAMLVTTKATIPVLEEQYKRVISILTDSGIEVVHYDGVIPNPTIESVDEGGKMARENGVDVIIGLGGGSSMDTAKAISVVATHPGSSWDYLFYKTPQPDAKKLLPIISISTTSGTGSQVTQVAVITNTETRDKSAMYNNILYPQVCIVDPELMTTLPNFVTMTTGFDVLCHAFESIINVNNNNPFIDLLAWQAIEMVVKHLPTLIADPKNLEAREAMAYADTLGGLSIANAGVTLPHGMGMAISGMYPHVAHGESLAIVYPACVEYTWESDVPNFAKLARTLDSKYEAMGDQEAAAASKEAVVAFLKSLGLYKGLKDVNMPEGEKQALATQCMVLPDYTANPRVTTAEEMLAIVEASYEVK